MRIVTNIAICLLMVVSVAGQNTATNYFTNSDEAQNYANVNNADILMVFGGSDWCRPCIKFKKDILDNLDFQKSTKGSIAILYLDFPSKKKNRLSKQATEHNEALAAKYNTSGSFPKIILMDHDMHKLREVAYEGQSVGAFVHLLKS